MGLFSKKTLICTECGKEFQTRMSLGVKLCDDCLAEYTKLSDQLKGYTKYSPSLTNTNESMRNILAHRNDILDKYREFNGISRSELKNASDNYRKLSDEEAADIIVRVDNSSVFTTIGAAYNENFFVLTQWEGVVVDVEDIFAVAYTSSKKIKLEGEEVIICAFFTNDPYIPVFTTIYTADLGLLDFKKSSRGRKSIEELFGAICPNLTYPVQDLKQLNAKLMISRTVEGNISKKDMQSYIGEILLGWGVANEKKMLEMDKKDFVPITTLLDQYGYILDFEIRDILKLDKMFNRNFWQKHSKKFNK